MFFVSVSDLIGGAALETVPIQLPGQPTIRLLAPLAGAGVNVYARGTTTHVAVYSDQHGIAAPAVQPLTTDTDGRVVDSGGDMVFVAQPAELDVWIASSGTLTRVIAVGRREDPQGLTDSQLAAYVMGIVPLDRQVDPNYVGLFSQQDTGFGVDAFGAITKALLVWPDGGYGTFEALTVTPPVGSGPSVVDEYTVTYRPFTDTSGTDLPASVSDPTAGWVPATDGQAGRPAFVPLDDQTAARLITRVPEIRPQHQAPFAANASSTARNNYVPSTAELAQFAADRVSGAAAGSVSSQTDNVYMQYVTGAAARFISNPTTDELIQWASHKWGIPTDRIRAQMHLESHWQMDQLSDMLNTQTQGHPEWYADYPAAYQIPGGATVWATTSIAQVHWWPDQSVGPGSEPLRWRSTAFSLDYYCSWVRFHLDNPQGNRVRWGDASYVPSDYEACQGGWFLPFPWRSAANKSIGDAVNGFELTAIGDAGTWTVTVQPNAGTPANKDLILYRDGVQMVNFANLAGGTMAAAVSAINTLPFNGHALANSTWGDQTTVMPDVTAEAMDSGGTMMNYVQGVESRLSEKPWLVADFSNSPDIVEVWHQPRLTRSSGAVSARPLPVKDAFLPASEPTGVPAAPTMFAGDGMVVLVWPPLPVSETGGSPLTSWFMVEADQGWVTEQGFASSFFRFGSPTSPLANGASLRFQVAAQNTWGIGPWSPPSALVTPTAGLPDQPTAVLVSSDLIGGTIDLSWTAPARVPADAITDWIVIPIDSSGVLQPGVHTGSAGLTFTLPLGPGTGLAYGELYTYMVQGVNAIGNGLPSIPSLPISTDMLVPPSRPREAPGNLRLYAGDGEVLLFWTAAPDDGGEAIESYFLWEPDEFWSQTQGFPNAGRYLFGSLANGHLLRFTAAAVNVLGTGPASQPSNYVTTTLGLPPQPTNVVPVAGGSAGQVDLTWSAPVPAPADAVTDYKIIPVIAGVAQAEVDVGSAATSFTVTGLTSGVVYTFEVRAVNAVGAGMPSYDSAGISAP